jgi:putative peptidoglycan lipid II flippase
MSRIVKASLQIFLWTGISKIFGFLRDLCIASVFGIGSAADIANVMLKMPNFFRRIFAEGALSNVFIPTFNQKISVSKQGATDFANQLLIYLLCIVLVIVSLIEIFMPYVVMLVAPGFISDPEKMANAVFLCRVSMPCLISITVVGLFGSVLNSRSRFFAFSISPVIMSLCIIIASRIYHSDSYHRVFYLAVGLLCSGLFQIAFMLIMLKKYQFAVPRFPKINSHTQVILFLKQLTPAALSASAIQVQILISQSIASFFPGAISILSYSERLYQMPLSILGVAFSTAILPELSMLYFKNDKEGVATMHNKSIKILWILTIPSTIILILLSLPIVSLVYERGSFNHSISFKVATTVALFSLGLPAIILGKLFNNLFYVHQNTSMLFKITFAYLVCNVLFNIILVNFVGYIGIPIGSSIASWLQIVLLVLFSFRQGYFCLSKSLIKWMLEVLLIGIFMGISIHLMYQYIWPLFIDSFFLLRSFILFIMVVISLIIYCAGIIFSKKISIAKNNTIQIR